MNKLTLPPLSITFFILVIYQISAQVPENDELVALHIVSTSEMNTIISPIQGSLIFNSDDNEVYQFNGTLRDRISSTGNEIIIIEGDDIAITDMSTTLDPYIINYSPTTPTIDQPVTDCSGGAQATSGINLNSTTNGIYCIDDTDTGPNSPYLTYCDMNTDGDGWARIVRTTSNNYHIGNGYSQVGVGYKGNNAGTYEIFVK
ncbi:MAG: fibrinogen-like YCDxxxxGGGW domain-containing protein [Flavobacteriaceae bacterium]